MFDIDTGREEVLPVAVNPAFAAPCVWMGSEELLCRIVPDVAAPPPEPYASPNIMDHPGGAARTRTYSNLLDSALEEDQFDYYFSSTLARVGLDGKVRVSKALPGRWPGCNCRPTASMRSSFG